MILVAHSANSRPSRTSSIDFGKLAFGTPDTAGTKSKSTVRAPLHERGDDELFETKGTRMRDFCSRHLPASLAKVTRAVASWPSDDT